MMSIFYTVYYIRDWPSDDADAVNGLYPATDAWLHRFVFEKRLPT